MTKRFPWSKVNLALQSTNVLQNTRINVYVINYHLNLFLEVRHKQLVLFYKIFFKNQLSIYSTFSWTDICSDKMVK